jgi:hypothetical protein
MNLDRVIPLWVAFCFGVGALVGATTSVGWPRALFWGGGIGMAPLLLLGLVGLWAKLIFRDRPVCICGSCRSADYVFLGADSQRPPIRFDYECPSCHRRYRARDDVFFELAADGSERPYMRQSRFGRWSPCT